jgi:hypothetical protein
VGWGYACYLQNTLGEDDADGWKMDKHLHQGTEHTSNNGVQSGDDADDDEEEEEEEEGGGVDQARIGPSTTMRRVQEGPRLPRTPKTSKTAIIVQRQTKSNCSCPPN